MKRTLIGTLTLFAAAAIIVGCASMPSDTELHADTVAMLKSSFKAKGQATMDRVDQDETQRVCSEYFGKPLPADTATRLEKANLAQIKWPADGHYLGDWKAGEKVAQEGRGKQSSDDPKGPVGGNCYACHQLTPQEISYGTIGPSLYQFGKLRGYNDEIRKYAYGKVYNAEAYAACSNMPRFGTHGILSEQQIKDVVALLMDPKSPVNQ
ncbi:MAG: sulfur oxidation c-type cytochrome SoxX [Betaproteobacteria bacterium]